MCQYVAENGKANTWHLVHLGGLAHSGAGMLCIEGTAVEPDGRITPSDLGLWDDATEAALKPVLAAAAPSSISPTTCRILTNTSRLNGDSPPLRPPPANKPEGDVRPRRGRSNGSQPMSRLRTSADRAVARGPVAAASRPWRGGARIGWSFLNSRLPLQFAETPCRCLPRPLTEPLPPVCAYRATFRGTSLAVCLPLPMLTADPTAFWRRLVYRG
jgi:hypothetical protein